MAGPRTLSFHTSPNSSMLEDSWACLWGTLLGEQPSLTVSLLGSVCPSRCQDLYLLGFIGWDHSRSPLVETFDSDDNIYFFWLHYPSSWASAQFQAVRPRLTSWPGLEALTALDPARQLFFFSVSPVWWWMCKYVNVFLHFDLNSFIRMSGNGTLKFWCWW